MRHWLDIVIPGFVRTREHMLIWITNYASCWPYDYAWPWRSHLLALQAPDGTCSVSAQRNEGGEVQFRGCWPSTEAFPGCAWSCPVPLEAWRRNSPLPA